MSPETPLDTTRPNLKQLQWLAEQVSKSTGLPIIVTEAKSWTNGKEDGDVYDVTVYRSTALSRSFRSCWDHLNGVRCGAEMLQRMGEARP